jgi:hypothetical protein
LSTEKYRVSRRRLLILGAVGSAIGAAIWLKPMLRRSRSQQVSIADLNAPAATLTRDMEGTLDTVITFIGALFGRVLSDTDRTELRERLAETLSQEPGRAQDYTVLAQQLDRLARDAGAAGFVKANTAQRGSIVDQIMHIDPGTMWSRILAHLTPGRGRYYRIRSTTVPDLVWLYRYSGVPWRARGYERWPGIPGDWHEYLTPGKTIS